MAIRPPDKVVGGGDYNKRNNPLEGDNPYGYGEGFEYSDIDPGLSLRNRSVPVSHTGMDVFRADATQQISNNRRSTVEYAALGPWSMFLGARTQEEFEAGPNRRLFFGAMLTATREAAIADTVRRMVAKEKLDALKAQIFKQHPGAEDLSREELFNNILAGEYGDVVYTTKGPPAEEIAVSAKQYLDAMMSEFSINGLSQLEAIDESTQEEFDLLIGEQEEALGRAMHWEQVWYKQLDEAIKMLAAAKFNDDSA